MLNTWSSRDFTRTVSIDLTMVVTRSTLTNLLEMLESWTRIFEEGFGVDVIYLDYRKAFDTVPHCKLLYKLKELGPGVLLITWIEQFLLGRQMRVKVCGSFSTWFEVLCGVPQGSMLGPLLFLIFVRDLPDWVENSIMMFADDTKVWARIHKLEENVSTPANSSN